MSITEAFLGRLMTVRETADHLRVSTRTLFTLTANGGLPALRIGRSVRYQPEAVAAYLERLAQGGGK